jgi:hypothetical protein
MQSSVALHSLLVMPGLVTGIKAFLLQGKSA